MRERLLGQSGLHGERQIETLAEIDHQQPEGAGAGEPVGGPQAVAHVVEPNHRQRRQIDAPLGRIRREEGALGPADPRDRLALPLHLAHQAERHGERRRGAGARQLGQAAAERGSGPGSRRRPRQVALHPAPGRGDECLHVRGRFRHRRRHFSRQAPAPPRASRIRRTSITFPRITTTPASSTIGSNAGFSGHSSTRRPRDLKVLTVALVPDPRHDDVAVHSGRLPPHDHQVARQDARPGHALAAHPQCEQVAGRRATGVDRQVAVRILDRLVERPGRDAAEHRGEHGARARNRPGQPIAPRPVPAGDQPALLDEPLEMLLRRPHGPEAEGLLHLAHRRRLPRQQPIPHEREDLLARLARRCPSHRASSPSRNQTAP